MVPNLAFHYFNQNIGKMVNNEQANIVFIDDEEDIRIANQQTLELAGFKVTTYSSAKVALASLNEHFVGVIICDICLPDLNGKDFLKHAIEVDQDLVVILITGHGDISLAVECMRLGAYDFIEKPFAADRLVESVQRALDKRQLILDNRSLREELALQNQLGPRIIGNTLAMKSLRKMVSTLAKTDADVLILGETGTGKELIARSLHEQSSRSHKNFVAINCGAIPEALIESELFGHEKGAFTNAETQRIGKFEYAQDGTLFLDEIESMSLTAQVRLLRVLQERTLERVGSNETIHLDIRIISASKVDLSDVSNRQTFRQDLYYRLNVVTIDIPPLRERREDIPGLFQHFLLIAASRYGKEAPVIPDNANQMLMSFNWPGNVRELRNVAERHVLLGDDCGLKIDGKGLKPCAPMSLAEHTDAFEKAMIEEALVKSGGVLKTTMDILDIPRKTLYDKMQKHGVDKKVYK